MPGPWEAAAEMFRGHPHWTVPAAPLVAAAPSMLDPTLRGPMFNARTERIFQFTFYVPIREWPVLRNEHWLDDIANRVSGARHAQHNILVREFDAEQFAVEAEGDEAFLRAVCQVLNLDAEQTPDDQRPAGQAAALERVFTQPEAMTLQDFGTETLRIDTGELLMADLTEARPTPTMVMGSLPATHFRWVTGIHRTVPGTVVLQLGDRVEPRQLAELAAQAAPAPDPTPVERGVIAPTTRTITVESNGEQRIDSLDLPLTVRIEQDRPDLYLTVTVTHEGVTFEAEDHHGDMVGTIDRSFDLWYGYCRGSSGDVGRD